MRAQRVGAGGREEDRDVKEGEMGGALDGQHTDERTDEAVSMVEVLHDMCIRNVIHDSDSEMLLD